MSAPAHTGEGELARPRRLLFVVNVSWFFVSHRLELAKAARKAGYDVHVAAMPSGDVETIEGSGLSFHPIELHRGRNNPFKDISLLLSLYKLYRRLQPDIVHHVTIKPIVYGSVAARLARVPGIVNAIPGLGSVFLATGLRAGIRGAFVLWLYRLALPHRGTRVIFQNDENREFFVRRGLVNAEDAVLIKGSGVNLEEFSPSPEPPSTPTVILPARMLEDKGVREFVEAASMLKDRGVAARFALVGPVDSDNPTGIRVSQLEEWCAAGHVEWWGQRSDMSDVFRGAHIVCLPSYGEGMPKALIEAAASARAIVASNVSGCRDIVRDGWNGLLVPPKSAGKLADALGRLLEDPALRRRFGRNGRRLVEREFGLDRVVSQTLATYEELASEMSPGPSCRFDDA